MMPDGRGVPTVEGLRQPLYGRYVQVAARLPIIVVTEDCPVTSIVHEVFYWLVTSWYSMVCSDSVLGDRAQDPHTQLCYHLGCSENTPGNSTNFDFLKFKIISFDLHGNLHSTKKMS